MKSNMLSQLFPLALAAPMYAAENTGGGKAEPAFQVKVPEKVASWHEQGKIEGRKVHDQIEKGEMYARDALLVYGLHLAEHDSDGNLVASANDFINGYVSAWSNPNTQKQRKTEIKAVFDALAMGDEPREVTVDMTTPEKGSKESPTPIKETHTIKEWILMHQDVKGREGYAGLVAFARELRGPASGRGAGGGANRGPRVVTDKQQGEIEARIEVMAANQAHSVAQRAMVQLAKLPQFEVVQFRMIVSSCDIVLNKSTNEPAKKRAQAIRDMAEDMVEQLKKATDAVLTTPKISTGAPAPAKAVSEVQDAPAPAQQPKTGTSG